MPSNKTDAADARCRQQLNASFTLAGYLLEAFNEETAIRAAMQISGELLGAEGAVFLPLNEWKKDIPVIKSGDVSLLPEEEWQTRLAAPATRQACRICEAKQAGPECVLLKGVPKENHVFCVGLRCAGREIGNISYFSPVPLLLNDDQHLFLAEMVRLVDLTLVALRAHDQEVEAARRYFVAPDQKITPANQAYKSKLSLEQLEYKAVLDERTRLAREIHDGMAQTLAFLKLEAARMQAYVTKGELEAVARMLQACYTTLAEAYLDARQAIDDLRHVPDESLGDWLQTTAEDFQVLTGTTVDMATIQLDSELSPKVKAQVIRIVQEALTNVRKHAQSNRVDLCAFEREGLAIVEIRDNGRGFIPKETIPTSQYGLRSMRERAESIAADLQISSLPGAGTTIHLRIPIREGVSP
jgi:signal transduction histidine kinase